jgi:hypothetical protein
VPLYDFTDIDDGVIPADRFARLVQGKRRGLLRSSDWRVAEDAPGDRNAWIAYRAALRDGPAILATRVNNAVLLPDPPEDV